MRNHQAGHALLVVVAASLLGGFFSPESIAAQPSDATVLYLLRHAEKDTTGSDPGLIKKGQARAKALAKMLGADEITTIYSTPYRRTMETVAPLAERLGLQIETLDIDPRDLPGHAEAVARVVRDDHPGDHIVIVGHSNTVPMILKALGVPDPPELADPDYGDLFVVVLAGKNPPQVVHLRFGD